jgi:hypothetical protein
LKGKIMIKKSMPLIASALILGTTAATAAIDIGGNQEQSFSANNSPITTLAIGPGANAGFDANDNEGKVSVGGNQRQVMSLNNSPVTTLAIGPAASAKTRINGNYGK